MSNTATAKKETISVPKCTHCGLPIPIKRVRDAEGSGETPQFCCAGCQYVYQIIHESGFSEFYELKDKAQASALKPADPQRSDFSHFADPAFVEKFVKDTGNGNKQVSFYLEGIYCAACVWLLEKLPEILPGVSSARVDFGRSQISVVFNPETVLVPLIAKTLDSFGYLPRPLDPSGGVGGRVKRAEERKALLRIGVAGVCAGNTMMLAISLYQGYFTGIEGRYQSFFQWASLCLALPVVFYSALPFYRRAFGGLRAGALHIDLPITLGIVVGFIASAINTVLGHPHVYYDSLCMLVFLLLLGRWFQQKGVTRALDANNLLFAFSPASARKVTKAGSEVAYVESLKRGDRVEVEPGEVIPADGVVLEGASQIDAAILTGESWPRKTGSGDEVFAGTKNLESRILVRVSETHSESRIGKIMSVIESASHKKAPLVELTDKIGGYFVATVLLLASVTFIYCWVFLGFYVGLDRTLALLVVTCPCALGLSAPISLSVAVRKAASSGIVIRGAEVIERLNRIKHVFFDKTGTLTSGEVVVDSFFAESEGEQLLPQVFELEREATHPVGAALRAFSREAGERAESSQLTALNSLPGKGVEGVARDGSKWRVGSLSWQTETGVQLSAAQDERISKIVASSFSPAVLSRDDEVLGIFALGDSLRPDATQSVQQLREKGISTAIISGDHSEVVSSVAAKLGISQSGVYGELSPEEKLEIVINSQAQVPTAMVGDGVNDAAALQAAEVGIGMSSGAEVCLKVADVFLINPELAGLSAAFSGATKTIGVIKRNISFSLIYNLLGALGAMTGVVTPLIAAVLMPLSSLTVVLTSLFSKTFEE